MRSSSYHPEHDFEECLLGQPDEHLQALVSAKTTTPLKISYQLVVAHSRSLTDHNASEGKKVHNPYRGMSHTYHLHVSTAPGRVHMPVAPSLCAEFMSLP